MHCDSAIFIIFCTLIVQLFKTRENYDAIELLICDFLINNMTFEIGGKNKGQKQIQGIENSFIVKDDIEFGY
ncbi:hypothetical protein BSYN_21330 [Bacteroides sedimenti]|uniref:Uncharacterized protein n=1 Tax=Bacteroides sedimenti TaxID=2136147 RepID=A0ABM8ID37_9BACE